jgi:hypothetical protein
LVYRAIVRRLLTTASCCKRMSSIFGLGIVLESQSFGKFICEVGF